MIWKNLKIMYYLIYKMNIKYILKIKSKFENLLKTIMIIIKAKIIILIQISQV